MSAKSPIDFLKFARDLRIGDIIETGCCEGDEAALIDVQHFINATALCWGVGDDDRKMVSPFTGIVFRGRFEPVINV
jgi:hypothetical protein